MVLALATGPGAAWAEDDPPGVARVSVVEGPASYRLGGAEDWTGVAINAPLVTGDSFFSGEGARAEIQLAPGTYARLGATTQLDLVELAPDATQVRVVIGSAIIRLRDVPHRRHVELDTPAVALTLTRAGSYRVDVEPGGRTTVRVGRGEAVAHVGDDRFDLYAQSSALIDPTAGASAYRPIAYAGEDDLDLWDRERDARVEASESFQHVSDEIYGVEDLDENGVWEYHRGYGQLWRPTTVSVGWAPYRDGRWVYVEPWGWTWLDYAAWGWAPFHYGRWVSLNSYWYWAPGTVIARPVYAPALVGFYGYGAGFGWGASVSVGIGAGYVGWVPLGWGEPCYPWWGFGGARVGYAWWGGWGGPRVVNNVIIKQKNIYNINVRDVRHANRRHRGGFTKVDRREFGRGGRFVPVGERERRSFRAVGGRVGVTPNRSSRRAVEPGRESVRRGGRPAEGVERAGVRRAGLTDTTGGRDRAGRGRDGSGVRRGSSRSERTQLAAGRSVSASPTREAVARRGSDRDARSALRSPGQRDDRARSSVRGVVPRPPTRVETSRAPSAPRRFARRSEPYVADRPDFSSSRSGTSRAGVSRGSETRSGRSAVARRGTSSERSSGTRSRYTASRSNRGSERSAVGRAPTTRSGSSSRRVTSSRSSGGSRESASRSTPRSTGRRSTVRSSNRSGGLKASVVGRSGVSRLSSPSRSSRRSVSASGRPQTRSVTSSRASTPRRSFASAGSGSSSRRSVSSTGSRSFSASRRGGSSLSGGRGRSSLGRGGGSLRSSGSRSFGGSRSFASARGGGTRGGGSRGGGRASVGRR